MCSLGGQEVLVMDEIWTYVGKLVGALGGASIMIFGLSNYFGRIFADRFVETKRRNLTQKMSASKGS